MTVSHYNRTKRTIHTPAPKGNATIIWSNVDKNETILNAMKALEGFSSEWIGAPQADSGGSTDSERRNQACPDMGSPRSEILITTGANIALLSAFFFSHREAAFLHSFGTWPAARSAPRLAAKTSMTEGRLSHGVSQKKQNKIKLERRVESERVRNVCIHPNAFMIIQFIIVTKFQHFQNLNPLFFFFPNRQVSQKPVNWFLSSGFWFLSSPANKTAKPTWTVWLGGGAKLKTCVPSCPRCNYWPLLLRFQFI